MELVSLFLCILVFGSELYKRNMSSKDEFLSSEQDVKVECGPHVFHTFPIKIITDRSAFATRMHDLR